MSTLTLQADVRGLKAEKEKLQIMVNQYARQLIDLEERVLLLQSTPSRATVSDRILAYMQKGKHYKPSALSEALHIPLNTVHVTLKRHPKLFQRVERGLYARG